MAEVLNNLLGFAGTGVEWLARQFMVVLLYPFMSSSRIYILYLITSLIFALYVYSRTVPQDGNSTLLEYLFPTHIWSNASAWLDVRYFFIYQGFRLVIYGALMATVTVAVFNYVSTFAEQPVASSNDIGWPQLLLYVVIAALAVDFVAYISHYMQHKIPLLWEFHKVHHSATVMHPLTNYREHPVDNVLYAITTGACIGVVTGGASLAFGHVPKTPTILGIGVLMFLYNVLGYNLRHSHIWLRWPGRLSMVFGSPAHHQVHHSCHPDHIDRNFAFMFPVWDVIFKTYCLPETNKDVRFGLNENQEQEFRSVLGIWFLPFRSAWKLMTSENRAESRDRGRSLPP